MPILYLATFWSILSTKPTARSCSSGINLVVILEYPFFQLCFKAEQISWAQKILKKLCKPPYCCNQPLPKFPWFFCLIWAAQCGQVRFFVAVCRKWLNFFAEHTSCSIVVNSKVAKQTKKMWPRSFLCCCLFPVTVLLRKHFFDERICCLIVVNSKVGKQTKRCEIVINKYMITNSWRIITI